MVLKLVAGVLSPSGPPARLSILIFHRVLHEIDPLFPNEQYAQRFDQTLSWISRWFRVLPLDEAIARLRDGTLPARAMAITFDDGYADNATVALSILKRHGMAATFFVATSFLNGGRMWNDSIIESVRTCTRKVLDLGDAGLGSFPLESDVQRRQAIDALLARTKYLDPEKRAEVVGFVTRSAGRPLPDDLMMSSSQVIGLRQAGMQIGAHTCTHPILANLSDDDAAREIARSKADLESLLGESVSLFAYPNGKPGKDYLAKHVAIVEQAGFAAAVSTAPGVSDATTDRFQLPRFSPWDRSRLRYGVRMLANLRNVARPTPIT